MESKPDIKSDRKDQRGAALVMVLMISFLLMVAVISLLFEASMNTGNVTDATAEQQAYYAAEAGIQSVINVLRHNTPPDPPIDSSKTPLPPDPDADPANKIDYFKAVRIKTSNKTEPPKTECESESPPPDCTPRMSRWLNYGNNKDFPDRIVLGDAAANYTERNGFAFRVAVEDPDNVGGIVSYQAQTSWTPPSAPPAGNLITVAGNQLTITDTTNNNQITVEYEAANPYVKDVSSGDAVTDFGKFKITGSGETFDTDGVTISAGIRYAIRVELTEPYAAIRILRGYFEKGTIKAGSVGKVRFFFDSRDYVVFGSLIRLTGGTLVEEKKGDPGAPSGPDGTFRTGYEILPTAPSAASVPAETIINGTISSPEPLRILIRSTGFGPNGARKDLEAVIQKNYFSGLGAPSPLTLIGPPCTPVATCVPSVPPVVSAAPKFVFNPGSSNVTVYSGKDKLLKAFLPPIGVTNDPNLAIVRAALGGTYGPFNGSVFGNTANIADELPYWLQSPARLEATLEQLRNVARASGRYYGPTTPRPGNGDYGDNKNATGITFIEGDLEFSGAGGGILVVTGGLKFQGGFDFNGLIVVTGDAGISRTGGGKGSLQGNMIVAPYKKPDGLTCSEDITVLNKLKCFLAPRYDISGGGSSEIVYNSNNVANGLDALTNFAKGVAEK